MANMTEIGKFHYSGDLVAVAAGKSVQVDQFTYTFENFFHPFVGDMIKQLNQGSVATLLDPAFQAQTQAFFTNHYTPVASSGVKLTYFDKAFDVASALPYANYNWEILFHIPVMIAVHLSS